jgi:MFS family permease
LGAIAGSLFVASVKKGANLKIIMVVSTAILALGLICFSRVSYFPLAMPFAVIIGFGSLMPMTIGITIIQVEAAPNMRGRMMSYTAMAFFGMLPLGSLLAGIVSQKITAPLTMLSQGIIALVIAAVFFKFMKEDKLAKKDAALINTAEEIVTEKP